MLLPRNLKSDRFRAVSDDSTFQPYQTAGSISDDDNTALQIDNMERMELVQTAGDTFVQATGRIEGSTDHALHDKVNVISVDTSETLTLLQSVTLGAVSANPRVDYMVTLTGARAFLNVQKDSGAGFIGGIYCYEIGAHSTLTFLRSKVAIAEMPYSGVQGIASLTMGGATCLDGRGISGPFLQGDPDLFNLHRI